jgi:hypothetical protein
MSGLLLARGGGMNHFTNKEGFDGIRSQPTWAFRASQPLAPHNPVGAYFTNYEQDEHNLAVKLFLPREKLHYIFSFIDRGDLLPLPGGRGRLKHIFYSPVTYEVERGRQTFHGRTGIK